MGESGSGGQASYTSGNPRLVIDGQDAPPKLMEDLLQIVVEESLHFPSMFTIAIRNDSKPGGESDTAWEHQDLLKIGTQIEVYLTSGTSESSEYSEEQSGCVGKGEVTAIETHLSERAQAPIILRGYDVSHRLHRGRWNRSFQNMTDADIVKRIAGEAGIQLGTIEEGGVAHEYAFQQNQTNMEFLRERAERLGFELFVRDGKLNFRKPKKDQVVQLQWLRNLHSFRVRVSSAEQVKNVEVRGWDYKSKSAIVSKVSSEKVQTETGMGKGSENSTKFEGKPSDPTWCVVDRPISSPREAELMAQAIFDGLGGTFVYADGKGEGNPEIRPGRAVKLQGIGKYEGEYYVTETRHIYYERNYNTEFGVRGLQDGDVLSTLAPPSGLRPGQTLMAGIVTNNEDPEGLGRVKVKFPTLTEEHESNWARIVGHGVGPERGNDCIPEVDDEVLVGFEHGDIHRPYIFGGVWNGKDTPPENILDTVSDGNVRLRTFKTRTGHTLQFIEEDKGGVETGVQIKTAAGHLIQMNDTQKTVEIVTNGGHKVSLNDMAQSIAISSTGALSFDSKGGVQIKSSGKITLEASEIELK